MCRDVAKLSMGQGWKRAARWPTIADVGCVPYFIYIYKYTSINLFACTPHGIVSLLRMRMRASWGKLSTGACAAVATPASSPQLGLGL
jgi:hypothetical protein